MCKLFSSSWFFVLDYKGTFIEHFKGVVPSPPGLALGRETTWEEGTPKEPCCGLQAKGMPGHRGCEHDRRKCSGTGSRRTGEAGEDWTESLSYLLLCETLLLCICLFQLLLPDLRVLLLVDHSRKIVISVFSLNQVTLLFHIPLAGWLSLVATVLVMAEIYTVLTFLVRCIHII